MGFTFEGAGTFPVAEAPPLDRLPSRNAPTTPIAATRPIAASNAIRPFDTPRLDLPAWQFLYFRPLPQGQGSFLPMAIAVPYSRNAIRCSTTLWLPSRNASGSVPQLSNPAR